MMQKAGMDSKATSFRQFLTTASSLLIFHERQTDELKIQDVLNLAREEGVTATVYRLNEDEHFDIATDFGVSLQELIEKEKIGTRIYVYGSSRTVKSVQSVCRTIGLSEEEAWFESINRTSPPVFCAGCYHINPSTNDPYLTCERCGRILTVSQHYSDKKGAVMGYLTIPKKNVESSMR